MRPLRIAHYWRELTKTFMFTTIAGLGNMAKEAAEDSAPPSNDLSVIQTLFRVIGDDLNNEMHIFRAAAPPGVDGIHYVWWENTVLRPIANRLGRGYYPSMPALPTSVQNLRENMHRLSDSALGTAVQLRVVEAIALDLVIAFKRIFSRVVIDGQKMFPTNDTLAWMNAHIQAEVAHNKEVSDHDTGMSIIADTDGKQAEMLTLAAEYVTNWNAALNDFAAVLN